MKSLNQSSSELQLISPKKNKYAFNPIQELDLKTSKSNRQDYLQLTNILTNILPYPSNQLAELHMESNRLGRYDIAEQVKTRTQGNTKGQQARDNLEHCPCCGFIRQTQQLKVCSQLQSINNIGVSTYLYFKTIKNLVFLLIIMTILYSLYAFITNAVASKVYQQTIGTDVASNLNSVDGYVAVSLGSKQLNPTQINKTYYYAQCWIGFVMIIVWLISFFAIKYYEAFQQIKIDDQNISAADFTISIQHMPKDVTKQELQAQFNKYYETLGNVPQKLKEQLKIAKINIGTPFYLNKQDFKDKELQQLKKRKRQLIQIFIGWIKERQSNSSFSLNKQERNKIYEQYQNLLKKEQNKYKQIQQKIKENMKLKATKETTTVFVTFEHSKSMRLVTGLNDPSIAAIIRFYLTCCRGHHRFNFYRGEHNYNVKIEKAPEPQDIAWNHLAVPLEQRIKKKAITFSVTFVLLGISFAIIYGLSQVQQNEQDNNYLSFVISIIISVIGIVLEAVIKKLSQLEYDSTIIKYQTSVAIKCIIAQLLNSILIPILVDIYIKNDVYGQNGLASDVFMIGLTSSFLTPLLKMINFGYIMKRLYKFYVSRTNSRLGKDQIELNEAFQYVQFEIGSQYVEIVSLYLFVCFFVSLQPIISLFAIGGFIMMYWVQKYNIFNRMKRPVPGNNLINNTMFQIIISGGIMFSLGSLTWSNFMDNGIPKAALIPNLFTLFASIIMFLMPYRAIVSLFIKQSIAKQMKFSEKRIALSSQYDRLNPVTSADALKEFQQYFKKKFDNSNQQQKNKLSQEIIKNLNKGHHKPPGYAHHNIMGNFFQPGLAFMPPPLPPQFFMINASTQNGTRSLFSLQNQSFHQPILQVPGLQQPNFKPLVITPNKPQNTIRGNYPYNHLPGISPMPSSNNLYR